LLLFAWIRSSLPAVRPSRHGLGAVEQCLDFVELDGFGDMKVEAGIRRAPAIFGLSPTGQRNQYDGITCRGLAYSPRHFISVDRWQTYIQQYDVRPPLFSRLQPGQPAKLGSHLMGFGLQ
jgi:hypothetical protein